jgi:hypothetical protein
MSRSSAEIVWALEVRVRGPPQAGQYRQAHRAGHKRQAHHDPGDDEAGPEPDGLGAFRRSVVLPERTEHLLPAALEQRVIDDDRDRGALRTSRWGCLSAPWSRTARMCLFVT